MVKNMESEVKTDTAVYRAGLSKIRAPIWSPGMDYGILGPLLVSHHSWQSPHPIAYSGPGGVLVGCHHAPVRVPGSWVWGSSLYPKP